MAQCPFHPDTKASCSIHLERKVFYCFGCGAKGSVLDFVALLENVSIHDAADRIEKMCRIRHDRPVPQRREATQNGSVRDTLNEPLRPLPFRLTLDPSHPYLAGRHIENSPLRSARVLQPRHHGGSDLHPDQRRTRCARRIHRPLGQRRAAEGVPKYDLPRQFPSVAFFTTCTVSPAPSTWSWSRDIGRSFAFTVSAYRPSLSWGERYPLSRRHFL